jgi:hypothetical protein
MKKKQTQEYIESFANLIMYPMPVPNTGCIATGKLTSGFDITVTGGNTGQAADGHETFLVEIVDDASKDDPRIITKKNMSRDDLALLIEHHYKNRFRKRRPRNNYYGRH